jgi:hypothetical protein
MSSVLTISRIPAQSRAHIRKARHLAVTLEGAVMATEGKAVPSNMALVRTRREPACFINRRAAARRTTPR